MIPEDLQPLVPLPPQCPQHFFTNNHPPSTINRRIIHDLPGSRLTGGIAESHLDYLSSYSLGPSCPCPTTLGVIRHTNLCAILCTQPSLLDRRNLDGRFTQPWRFRRLIELLESGGASTQKPSRPLAPERRWRARRMFLRFGPVPSPADGAVVSLLGEPRNQAASVEAVLAPPEGQDIGVGQASCPVVSAGPQVGRDGFDLLHRVLALILVSVRLGCRLGCLAGGVFAGRLGETQRLEAYRAARSCQFMP